MKKIGFIGMGNMAQAMAVGLLRASDSTLALPRRKRRQTLKL